jgi:membrane protease YdiL (CAAX protease family)
LRPRASSRLMILGVRRATYHMNNNLGQSFCSTKRKAVFAAASATCIVIADFLLILFFKNHYSIHVYRAVLTVVSVVIMWVLAGFDYRSIGFTFRLQHGICYWIKSTVFVSIILLLLSGSLLLISHLANLPFPSRPLGFAMRGLFQICVRYPIQEELLYRLVLCAPLLGLIGSRGIIIVSGVTFAAVHFASGNANPGNFVAGYFLAWAYVKSGSIAVPIAWHSLGNFFGLVNPVINYYLLS